MKRALILLVCVLGFLSFASAVSVSSQCELVFYGPPPPPVCTTVMKGGKPTQECHAVGAAPSRTVVDGSKTSFNGGSDAMYEVDFSGKCNCKVILYSGKNYSGESFSYSFSNAKNGVIFAEQIWAKSNLSFKIQCCF